MAKKHSSSILEFMKIRRIYDNYLENGERFRDRLLKHATRGPHDLKHYTRQLIGKCSERGEASDLVLIEDILNTMVSELGLPLTRTRIVNIREYFRFSVVYFAGFLGRRCSRGMEIVVRNWSEAVGIVSRTGIVQLLIRTIFPVLAKTVFAAEGRRFIQRSERLPGEIGPVIGLPDAVAFFKRSEESKQSVLSFCRYCRPDRSLYREFAGRADEIIGSDDPFAYNIGTGAFLVQGSLNFPEAYYLLERQFDSGNAIAKYEALRILFYILEVWPGHPVPEALVTEAERWTRDLLISRRRVKNRHNMNLDYSYPISQLALTLATQTSGSERRAMSFFNGWLTEFGADSSPEEKIIIIRGLKQYLQMLGAFLTPPAGKIIDFAGFTRRDAEHDGVVTVALTALRELMSRFPKGCSELLDAAGTERNIPELVELRAREQAELPIHAGHSVNLTRFFQNILAYGGEVRTVLLDLVMRMGPAPSLERYLADLGLWFLDGANIEMLASATSTVTPESQIAPDLDSLPPVLDYLRKKHRLRG